MKQNPRVAAMESHRTKFKAGEIQEKELAMKSDEQSVIPDHSGKKESSHPCRFPETH